jgi:hypothetical protein
MEPNGTEPSTSIASDTLFSTILKDPLSDVTRKERIYLLATSTLGIVIVKTGLVPSRISALGIQFEETNQKTLLLMLGIVVAYFFVAFIIYAVADFFAWLDDYRAVVGARARLEKRLNGKADTRRERVYSNLREGIPNTEGGDWKDEFTVHWMQELDKELKDDLRSSEVGRYAERMELVSWTTAYPEDAPPLVSVQIGEEPESKQERRRVMVVAVVRATFEYVLPVLWGVYAVVMLVT